MVTKKKSKRVETTAERLTKFELIERLQMIEDLAPHSNPPSPMDEKIIALYAKHIGPPSQEFMEDRLSQMSNEQIETLISAMEEVVRT